MSYSNYENPIWLCDAVAAKVRGRQSLGALRSDYNRFMSLFSVRVLQFPLSGKPTKVENSETVVELVTKEYVNDSQQVDKVEVKGQRSASQSSARNHQLTIGKEKTKQFTIGGNIGLNASFFNVGGVGVGLNASGSRSITKKREEQDSESVSATLGKEYSITGSIDIPAKTRAIVTITTYTESYKVSNISVEVSAPASAYLKIRLANACCCRSKYCFISAEDFLKSLCGSQQANISRGGGVVKSTLWSELTYLGEKTVVTKETSSAY